MKKRESKFKSGCGRKTNCKLDWRFLASGQRTLN